MAKKYNCPTTMKTIERDVETEVRNAISICCAVADHPVDWDGIVPRFPSADESAAAMSEVAERGDTLLDMDADDEDDDIDLASAMLELMPD